MRITSSLSGVRSLNMRQRSGTCALIVLYLLGISGLPAGPGAIHLGCRCDQILRESGNCCCVKRTGAVQKATGGSCCAKRSTPATTSAKSCCSNAGKSKQCDDRPLRHSVTACSCESPAEAGFLLNTDPRVLADIPFSYSNEWTGTCSLINQISEGRSLSPATPPPKSLSC